MLPKVKNGDLLVVKSKGEYEYSKFSNYNKTLRPVFVFVKDEIARLVVKKQMFADKVRGELMKFSKYHGLGNDFIITEYQKEYDYSKLAIKFCQNHISIGADGFIVVKKEPLEMIFYNQDGSMAPMCGNGIRAFARYVFENKIVNDHNFAVKTNAGILRVEILEAKQDNFIVKINMGKPIFDNKLIKASDDLNVFGREILIDKKYIIYSLFMGTIHTVILTDDLNISEYEGNKLCNYPLFLEKTNVNFVKKIDKLNYKVKTYERGVGFTYACGTGACATFVILNKLGLVQDLVNIHLKYGVLTITKEKDDIYMQGSVCHIFDTEIEVKKNEF